MLALALLDEVCELGGQELGGHFGWIGNLKSIGSPGRSRDLQRVVVVVLSSLAQTIDVFDLNLDARFTK